MPAQSAPSAAIIIVAQTFLSAWAGRNGCPGVLAPAVVILSVAKDLSLARTHRADLPPFPQPAIPPPSTLVAQTFLSATMGRAKRLWLRSKLSLCGLVILSEAKNLSAQPLHCVQYVGSNAELEQARFLLSQEKSQ